MKVLAILLMTFFGGFFQDSTPPSEVKKILVVVDVSASSRAEACHRKPSIIAQVVAMLRSSFPQANIYVYAAGGKQQNPYFLFRVQGLSFLKRIEDAMKHPAERSAARLRVTLQKRLRLPECKHCSYLRYTLSMLLVEHPDTDAIVLLSDGYDEGPKVELPRERVRAMVLMGDAADVKGIDWLQIQKTWMQEQWDVIGTCDVSELMIRLNHKLER